MCIICYAYQGLQCSEKGKGRDIETQLIFERRIRQGEEMDAVYSGAINILRTVTINKNGKIYILLGALRTRTKSTGNVDNWAKGGLGIGVK